MKTFRAKTFLLITLSALLFLPACWEEDLAVTGSNPGAGDGNVPLNAVVAVSIEGKEPVKISEITDKNFQLLLVVDDKETEESKNEKKEEQASSGGKNTVKKSIKTEKVPTAINYEIKKSTTTKGNHFETLVYLLPVPAENSAYPLNPSSRYIVKVASLKSKSGKFVSLPYEFDFTTSENGFAFYSDGDLKPSISGEITPEEAVSEGILDPKTLLALKTDKPVNPSLLAAHSYVKAYRKVGEKILWKKKRREKESKSDTENIEDLKEKLEELRSELSKAQKKDMCSTDTDEEDSDDCYSTYDEKEKVIKDIQDKIANIEEKLADSEDTSEYISGTKQKLSIYLMTKIAPNKKKNGFITCSYKTFIISMGSLLSGVRYKGEIAADSDSTIADLDFYSLQKSGAPDGGDIDEFNKDQLRGLGIEFKISAWKKKEKSSDKEDSDKKDKSEED